MATFAEITNGVVTNVIVAENIETLKEISNQLFVEYTEDNPAGIDWIYADGKFTPPSSHVTEFTFPNFEENK
jgi:hypothetical protein